MASFAIWCGKTKWLSYLCTITPPPEHEHFQDKWHCWWWFGRYERIAKVSPAARSLYTPASKSVMRKLCRCFSLCFLLKFRMISVWGLVCRTLSTMWRLCELRAWSFFFFCIYRESLAYQRIISKYWMKMSPLCQSIIIFSSW